MVTNKKIKSVPSTISIWPMKNGIQIIITLSIRSSKECREVFLSSKSWTMLDDRPRKPEGLLAVSPAMASCSKMAGTGKYRNVFSILTVKVMLLTFSAKLSNNCASEILNLSSQNEEMINSKQIKF